MQLGKGPGSMLPQPSENKDRVNKFSTNIWVDGTYYYNMVGYSFHGYTIIRIEVLAWTYYSLLMGMLPQTRCGASLVEDTVLSHHLQSKYPYPNVFLWVLLLSTLLLLCEPRV